MRAVGVVRASMLWASVPLRGGARRAREEAQRAIDKGVYALSAAGLDGWTFAVEAPPRGADNLAAMSVGDRRARRPLRGGAIALALSALTLLAGAASAQAQTVTPPGGTRIVAVRMYQNGQYVTKRQSPQTIGAALASLKPTYVTALLRFGAGEKVRPREARAWNTVVAAVRAANPDAQFSVELNAVQYPNAKRLRRMMASIRAKIDLDGWLFDFYTPAARKRPRVMRAAVAAAHANGEFLGGNAFGIANHPRIPKGTDYIAVQDFDFHIDLPAVRALARRATVFFHLGNSPNLSYSDGCKFIETFSAARREGYVRMRAGQQAANSFRLAYPVFFPECERDRTGRNATLFTYDAPRDGTMMQTIAGLMDQFTTLPVPLRR